MKEIFDRIETIDGVKTIKGDVDLSNKGLTKLPDLSDVVVTGGFNCSFNKLTTLTGAPHTVSGDFYCYTNNLTTLTGAPHTVRGDFYCSYNNLTTLEGLSSDISGNLYIEVDVLRKLYHTNDAVSVLHLAGKL